MIHTVASLLHFLAYQHAFHRERQQFCRIADPELCSAIPEAIALKLVEPEDDSPLGIYWLRLTARGRHVVDEILACGRVLIGGI